MTRTRIQSVADTLAAHDYESLRVDMVRQGRDEDLPALNLLEAGFSVGHVYTLFTIADRLRRYNRDRCNRPLSVDEVAWADREEGLARHILRYTVAPTSPAPHVPRTTVTDAEITGLPGGASFRVRLKSARTGEELRGNDFGDGRYTAF